jgi:arylsulfatase
MMEHDHRVGQILDALENAGIARDTLVIYASDNGPDSADYPRESFAGPFQGRLGSAYEGSIRTPMIVRWPGRTPAGSRSNEIVAMVDLLPTLARIAGGELPDDRAIDGVDQMDLFVGNTRESQRESVLVFSGDTLLAVKWRKFKIFLTGDDPGPRNRSWRRLWAPQVYNIEQDPREEYDIAAHNMWIFQPAMRQLMPFVFSIEKHGLIQPGADKRTRGSIQVPFLSEAQLKSGMDAIKRRVMKQRLRELLPFGRERESTTDE